MCPASLPRKKAGEGRLPLVVARFIRAMTGEGMVSKKDEVAGIRPAVTVQQQRKPLGFGERR